MIKVLFFASYREQLGCDQLVLKSGDYPATLTALREQLAERGTEWHEVMNSSRTLVAVNQTMTRSEHELAEGDEVAFFPPVTGG